MKIDLQGYKILVTGSTAGIGKEIARAFLNEGAKVCMTGSSQEKIDAVIRDNGFVRDKSNLLIKKADFTLLDQVQKLSFFVEEKWSDIDVLVCNIGSGRSVLPLKETNEEWERVLSLNLLTATNAVECFLPLLRKSVKKANIIFISSICGYEALGAPITYSVAKAGINALAKNLSRALGKENIRVNAISPGNILFKGSIWEKKSKEEPFIVEEMLKKEVPLQRLGNLQEIVAPVLFLASKQASFITGANLLVDGGQTRSV